LIGSCILIFNISDKRKGGDKNVGNH
jgi:hypothetical protein